MARIIEVLTVCSEAARQPPSSAPPARPAAQAQTDRLRRRMHEQLAEAATLKAVSRVPGFVQHHLRPLVAGAGGGGSGDSDGGGAVPGGNPAAAAAARPMTAQVRPHDSVPGSGMVYMHEPDAGCLGCTLLSNSASLVTDLVSGITDGSAEAAAASGAAHNKRRAVKGRFLAALKETRLVAALSAAVLAAPPGPEVAADARDMDAYTKTLVLVQRNALSVVYTLASETCKAFLAPLAAPEVRQLQLELLEQVAATNEQREAADSGGGGGGRAGARRRLWPLAQPHCLQHTFGGGVQLDSLMHNAISATVGTAFNLRIDGDAAAADAYTEALFPSRAAFAALAARVCAALHVHLASSGARQRPNVRRVDLKDLAALCDIMR